MPKQKSSATSATRKKHARKAAQAHGEDDSQASTQAGTRGNTKQKGRDKGKGKKKEPRVKQYIPPTKPQALVKDPIDVLGLAGTLSPELLVVLRRISKKDATTKSRGLEELTAWIVKTVEEETLYQIEVVIPAWNMHFPSLLLHSAKRIRLLASNLQALLLSNATLRTQVLHEIQVVTDPERLGDYFGLWLLSSFDIDRQVLQVGQSTWVSALEHIKQGYDNNFGDGEFAIALETFLMRIILEPAHVYETYYPWTTRPVTQSGPSKKRESSILDLDTSKRSEGEEEDVQDRNARIRVAALGALRWLIESSLSSLSASASDEPALKGFIAEPELWSILYPGAVPHFMENFSKDEKVEGFGANQPLVRRAGWGLVHTLAKSHLEACLHSCLPIISTSILRSIWIEPDASVRIAARDGLLTFLAGVPNAWMLSSTYRSQYTESDPDSEEDEETGRLNVSPGKQTADGGEIAAPIPAYIEFLQFLRLGCGGTATQFYPAIILVISTIPPSVLRPTKDALEELFEAFWAALDDHALGVSERGHAPIMAFVKSLLEVVVILVKRICAMEEGGSLAVELATAQVSRVWEYFCNKKLLLNSSDFGTYVGKTLDRLNRTGAAIFASIWTTIREQTIAFYQTASPVSSLSNQDPATVQFSPLWRALEDQWKRTPLEDSLHTLLATLTEVSLEQVFASSQRLDRAALYLELLEMMMGDLNAILRANEHLIRELHMRFKEDLLSPFTSLSAQQFALLIGSYLEFLIENPEKRQNLWHLVLTLVGKNSMNEGLKSASLLRKLLQMGEEGILKDLYANHELENMTNGLAKALGDNESYVLLRGLIEQHSHFLSHLQLQGTAESLFETIEIASIAFLRTPNYHSTPEISVAADLLALLHEASPVIVESFKDTLAGHLFALYFAAPLAFPGIEAPMGVKRLLDSLWKNDELPVQVLPEIRSWFLDLDIYPSAEVLINATMALEGQESTSILANIFPPMPAFDEFFVESLSVPPNPLLAAIDLLVRDEEVDDALLHGHHSYDKQNLSLYARLSWSLMALVSTDRQLVKNNMWILKHAFLLQQMAQDQIFTSRSEMTCFGPGISEEFLRQIIESIQNLSTYVFSGVSAFDLAHEKVVSSIKSPGKQVLGEPLEDFLVEICQTGLNNDSVRIGRIIRSVLEYALRGASVINVDQWLSLSRLIRRKAPQTSYAIVSAALAAGVETPLMNRMRNEAASEVTGVLASRANTEGTALLQSLLVLAPLPDSDIAFLPSQRAINLVQTIEGWISSDEDIEPIIESQTIALFCHLAPILQSLIGRHWEFAFDLIENTLENSSLTDADSLVALYRTLDLIHVILGLVITNKPLNASWSTRRVLILRLVRDMISSPENIILTSRLSSMCRSKALSILQGSPSGVLEPDSFWKLVPLLQVPVLETQKDAYGLVSMAAKMYTEKIVVEVGVNISEEVEARLPLELMALLEIGGAWEDDEDSPRLPGLSSLLTFFLGWMSVFDAFEDTSLRVRSSYVDQLRNRHVVQQALIPVLCDLLDIGKAGKKPSKLDLWELDAFYIELYEASSISILAAHVYYRALRTIPSLIRTWWMDCKDRQLSNAFAGYTATYFSPILISAELSNVKCSANGGGREKLEDEAVTIKIAHAISEVSLVYTVDDQQLEMTVKIPAEYPLKQVEVRDVKRVGVAEDKWRGWLFAAQQIITTQNGHITDALGLFKRNISLHFQGQTECAICYSIISVSDLQLPTKPCKTCKNRFHASCLYKWFKSSSSSSCPLCRSDIF